MPVQLPASDEIPGSYQTAGPTSNGPARIAINSTNVGINGTKDVDVLSLVKSVPVGTSLILVVSFLFTFITLLTRDEASIKDAFAVRLADFPTFLFLGKILANGFTHTGWYHFIASFLLFPTTASSLELSIGTFPFLYLFVLGQAVIGIGYILTAGTMNVLRFGILWLEPAPMIGLNVPFLFFLAIESLNKRGIYSFATHIGVELPEGLFPWVWVLIFMITMPFTSIWAHIVAVILGNFYFLGMVDFMNMPKQVINSFETARSFEWLVARPNFAAAPGAVSLPGAYFEPSTPTATANVHSGRESIVTRIKNAFSLPSDGSYSRLANEQNDTVDPLLWDEEDGPSIHSSPEIQPAIPKNPK